MDTIIEWAGAITGIVGALVIASNTRISPWGWWLFLASSLLMCVYAFRIDAHGVLALNVCFVLTNILGLVRVWWPSFRETSIKFDLDLDLFND